MGLVIELLLVELVDLLYIIKVLLLLGRLLIIALFLVGRGRLSLLEEGSVALLTLVADELREGTFAFVHALTNLHGERGVVLLADLFGEEGGGVVTDVYFGELFF